MADAAGYLSAIFRYPIKGFTGQNITEAALTVGRGIRHDRRFAIANGWQVVDTSGEWVACHALLRLNRNRSLGRFKLTFEQNSTAVVITHPDGCSLHVEFDNETSLKTANGIIASWFEKGPGGDAVLGGIRTPDSGIIETPPYPS